MTYSLADKRGGVYILQITTITTVTHMVSPKSRLLSLVTFKEFVFPYENGEINVFTLICLVKEFT